MAEVRPRVNRVIIVEGKYDKIKLASVVDAKIFVTNGFRVFTDREAGYMLRTLAEKNGAAILTDSDSAGLVIRNHLKNVLSGCDIINLYLPQITGKEPRKSTPSKEGFLGVEGTEKSTILEVMSKAGLFIDAPSESSISNINFYNLGYSGKPDSRQKRAFLLERLNLPSYLSKSSLLEYINLTMSKEEFKLLNEEITTEFEAKK